jgi:hypothetical protein
MASGLPRGLGGYAAAVNSVADRWKRSHLYDWLRLNGWVAFNAPRMVSVLGSALLTGIVVAHGYVLSSQPMLPTYFAVYVAILTACCLLTASFLWLGRNPRVPQLGWVFGDLISVVFLGVYLATRAAPLPGLVAVTGRWDFAPGTFAAAFALGFVAVHMSVLLGINVAYPQRQQWTD